ncbi:MAG: hypothetical protein CVU59_03270 [Deltaproteobacteria bacterium HGW-Deltaproteobacteria-17]|nr:MAG: hypothetical protein CVU59_03270 [Deltaproteobacteria bacterium HGW-Deltaproteobacteria-17]
MRCVVTKKFFAQAWLFSLVVLLGSGCRILMPISDVEEAACGDGRMDGAEACDGADLGDQTCGSLGFTGGVLSCNVDCSLNTLACTSDSCGNGVLDDTETCEPGVGATVEGCGPDCQVVEGWSCDGTPSVCSTICSDGLILGDEECDGTNLGTATCETAGYDGGTLLCDAQCRLDVSGCRNDFTALTCGANHCCLLGSDGVVMCWGGNESGQIGDGTTTDRRRPVVLPALSGVVAINAAFGTTCGVSDMGSPGDDLIYCWGSNDAGALGIGDAGVQTSTTPRVLPWSETLTGRAPGQLDGLGQHQCVLLSDGAAACWGRNDAGQIGDGQAGTDAGEPVILSGIGAITAISGGVDHSCAVLETASATSGLSCWGSNSDGQLGDGSGVDQPAPVEVEGFFGSVSCGGMFTCAVTTDARVRCWGRNNFGQLGIGNTTDQPVPVEVNLTEDAVSVATGLDHACALLVTGEIACWGRNRSGQLGDGTTTDRNTPVMVPGLSGVAGLATGHAHTCAFLQDQSVYCWGSNADGQLGVDNNRPSIDTPTAVVF